MKRFHVNVAVRDLDASVRFYATLFGEQPDVLKPDYAKWMLDDPRVNFSLSASEKNRGINHVGLQADTTDELAEIRARLAAAGQQTLDQPDAECCYAKSSKTWIRDPDQVSWETFVTFGEITTYGEDREPDAGDCCAAEEESCCVA
jgi:catechol 2,3-dioxygenase-like lactoylglutathione lyase family enzyme